MNKMETFQNWFKSIRCYFGNPLGVILSEMCYNLYGESLFLDPLEGPPRTYSNSLGWGYSTDDKSAKSIVWYSPWEGIALTNEKRDEIFQYLNEKCKVNLLQKCLTKMTHEGRGLYCHQLFYGKYTVQRCSGIATFTKDKGSSFVTEIEFHLFLSYVNNVFPENINLESLVRQGEERFIQTVQNTGNLLGLLRAILGACAPGLQHIILGIEVARFIYKLLKINGNRVPSSKKERKRYEKIVSDLKDRLREENVPNEVFSNVNANEKFVVTDNFFSFNVDRTVLELSLKDSRVKNMSRVNLKLINKFDTQESTMVVDNEIIKKSKANRFVISILMMMNLPTYCFSTEVEAGNTSHSYSIQNCFEMVKSGNYPVFRRNESLSDVTFYGIDQTLESIFGDLKDVAMMVFDRIGADKKGISEWIKNGMKNFNDLCKEKRGSWRKNRFMVDISYLLNCCGIRKLPLTPSNIKVHLYIMSAVNSKGRLLCPPNVDEMKGIKEILNGKKFSELKDAPKGEIAKKIEILESALKEEKDKSSGLYTKKEGGLIFSGFKKVFKEVKLSEERKAPSVVQYGSIKEIESGIKTTKIPIKNNNLELKGKDPPKWLEKKPKFYYKEFDKSKQSRMLVDFIYSKLKKGELMFKWIDDYRKELEDLETGESLRLLVKRESGLIGENSKILFNQIPDSYKSAVLSRGKNALNSPESETTCEFIEERIENLYKTHGFKFQAPEEQEIKNLREVVFNWLLVLSDLKETEELGEFLKELKEVEGSLSDNADIDDAEKKDTLDYLKKTRESFEEIYSGRSKLLFNKEKSLKILREKMKEVFMYQLSIHIKERLEKLRDYRKNFRKMVCLVSKYSKIIGLSFRMIEEKIEHLVYGNKAGKGGFKLRSKTELKMIENKGFEPIKIEKSGHLRKVRDGISSIKGKVFRKAPECSIVEIDNFPGDYEKQIRFKSKAEIKSFGKEIKKAAREELNLRVSDEKGIKESYEKLIMKRISQRHEEILKNNNDEKFLLRYKELELKDNIMDCLEYFQSK